MFRKIAGVVANRGNQVLSWPEAILCTEVCGAVRLESNAKTCFILGILSVLTSLRCCSSSRLRACDEWRPQLPSRSKSQRLMNGGIYQEDCLTNTVCLVY